MRIVAKIQGIAPSDWLNSRSRVAARAISIGVDAAGKGAQQDIRAMIRAVGMGQRLGNAVRQSTFPKAPRFSMRAASEVSASSNAADIIEAFSEGATIRGRGRYLAIPTAAVPRGRWNAKLTPREVETRFLRKLELRVLRGKPALVLVEARLTRGGAARGATRQQIARGRAREVVMFWLKASVTLPKRLAPRPIAASWARWVLRLSTEGADQVIRDLRAAATESAAAGRAYEALIKAQPALATGAERAEQALRKNVDAMRGMRGELNLLGAATQGVASSMGSLGSALTSPAAAIAALGAASAAGVVQIARIGDQYTETMNKLRAATGSVQAAGAVYSELVAMSQQTGASISESAGAFVRFSVAARAIGATNGEVLQLTRTIQQAGLISGASTQEAAAGVQQLGQALASGTLQGDELRSILENMPTLAETLAQQLGVSVGQLRTMGSEGQLTSDRVFQALLRASENINKQFTELTPTMGRAFGLLGQAMVEFVGKLDQALGLSQAIARAAAAAAAAVGRASGAITPSSPAERVEAAEQRLRTMQEQLRQAEEALAEQRRQFMPRNGSPERLAAAGRFADQDPQVQAQAQRIAALRQQIAAEGQVVTQARAEQDQAARQADDARQAEEATAAARRLAAARTAQTTAFNATRDALDQERKLRTDHATRITAIDAGLANGDTDAAGAARLRRMANDELADGLKALDAAARGRIETDESLAEVMRAVIDIEKDREALMRDGETVTQSVRTEVEKYADELARLNNLLGAGAISQDTYNRAVAAADPAVKAAADAAKRIEQENTRTTDRITSFFGDAFARAFEGTGNGFRGLMDSFKRAAISTFASIAAQAIIRPIIAPIVSSLGLGQLSSGNISGLFGGGSAQAATPAGGGGGGMGSAGSFSTLRTAYDGLTSPGGLGPMFPGGMGFNTGFGGIDGLLNTQLVAPAGLDAATNSALGAMGGAYGPATPGAIMGAGASPGLTIGSALGPGLAIAGGAYGVYSGLQRGGIGGYTSAAAGAVSAVTGLGMLGAAAGLLPALGVLGPIGLGVGALLAIGGSLLPGQKASGQGQLARQNLNSGEMSYEGLGGRRFSQANRDAATGSVQNIAQLAREIGDSLGGARIGGNVAVGVTNGTLYLDVNGQKAQFGNNEDGAKQLAETAGRMLVQEFRAQGVVSGDRASILNASGDNIQTLDQNLQWYEQVYKAFDKTADAADKTAEAIKAVEGKFNPLIDKAHELGLSSDNLVAARARESEAIVKAMADAEKARQAELFSIRSAIQARLTASSDAADYETRLLAGQASRAQAWGEELRQLEQRLVALGETTEATASQVGRLSEAQSAEYWRNFASSMQALDRSVIGRILRANGRTGDADRLDFEAGATAQISALSKVLADLGLSSAIAATKIAETQQAIDAERQAQARYANEQIVALDQSVISRILRATGRGNEAEARDFEAAAAQEVKNLAKSLDDLGFSAEVIAKKIAETEQAIGVERIALQKRIADESAAIQQESFRKILAAGQSIRDYLNGLQTNSGPGGVSAQDAFNNAGRIFEADRELANQGNAEALARVTTSADRLLNAAQAMYASGAEYQNIRSTVVERLGGLSAVESFDADQRRMLGFATGGSFTVAGAAGNDNLSLANVRVTAGETVSVSRKDTMSEVVAELRAVKRELATLRAERSTDARRMIQAGERAADATEDTAASTATMARREVIVGRRPRAA